jgi:hypothetical protein
MSKILDFPKVTPQRPRQQAQSSASSAEIVIFPGVRYERWDAAPAEDAPFRRTRAQRARIARDRLELID